MKVRLDCGWEWGILPEWDIGAIIIKSQCERRHNKLPLAERWLRHSLGDSLILVGGLPPPPGTQNATKIHPRPASSKTEARFASETPEADAERKWKRSRSCQNKGWRQGAVSAMLPGFVWRNMQLKAPTSGQNKHKAGLNTSQGGGSLTENGTKLFTSEADGYER